MAESCFDGCITSSVELEGTGCGIYAEGAGPTASAESTWRTKMKASRCASLSLALLVLVVMLQSSAQATITLSQRGCQTYASWSGNLVWARDLGADKEKA